MLIKNSKNNFKIMEGSELKKVQANPRILKRMEKLAKNIKSISPKSDDFLYFSIIFLKAAEASLYDENGNIKKIANGEKAWGYFDENWKWHGNVKPHKNNNSDIFPESELKKAASSWIGLPLCRDHESSSVDGIRGIILDTHYDEKYKQVVGLCALDRVNYPELARKVETGIVRFGSMGTAVERSVCFKCSNVASTPDQYCSHVNDRSTYGEINVGLKPIEYSLVVQPAEPGAILLKCIASLNKYKKDFSSMGISNVDKMLGSLSESQAEHLNNIMKSACGEDGCSIDKRDKIVRSFLNNNGIIKKTSSSSIDSTSEGSPLGGFHNEFYSSPVGANSINDLEEDEENHSPSESLKDITQTDYKESNKTTISANSKVRLSIKKALEGYKMSRFSKRREAKRKLAYMQGGESVDDKNYREPGTYKDEGASANQTRNTQDKQMHQAKSMGGIDQLYPGDSEVKQKLSRAKLSDRRLRRRAYMQGGESVDDKNYREPSTYKDESASANQTRNTQDKQMHQAKSMGGIDQLYPGDAERKQKLSRARSYNPISKKAGYTGPSLKTRLLLKKRANGTVDRKNSIFQVFAGNKKVIAAKAKDIYGEDLNRNWRWLASKEYGQLVCKEIRASGVDYVRSILKSAQEMPAPEMPAPEAAAPEMPAPEMPAPEMPAPEMSMPDLAMGDEPEMPELDDSAPEEEASAESDAGDEKSPSELIDEKLLEMENLISEIQSLKDEMEDEKMADVKVNVNVGEGEEGGDSDQAKEMESLASSTLGQLKTAMSELDQTADEMAMVSETYENIHRLSANQKRSFVKLASDAYDDSVEVIGQSKAVISMAKQNFSIYKKAKSSLKISNRVKSVRMSKSASLSNGNSNFSNDVGVQGLIKEALDLRRQKREALLRSGSSNISKQASQNTITSNSTEPTKKASRLEDELMERKDYIKTKLNNSFKNKQAKEEQGDYKIKLRRAYDVAIEMQKKGLINGTKASLDRQVDDIMSFDSRAFEAFKRTIANTKPVGNVRVGSDLGGINIGSNESQIEKVASRSSSEGLNASTLSRMWEK